MTLETFKKVTDELIGREIRASLEYPGFIRIPIPTSPEHLDFGAANETIMGDMIDFNDNVLESFESTIPSNTDDVQAVADFIAYVYTEATKPDDDVVGGPDPKYLADSLDQAREAFWKVIAGRYPNAKTGDFGPSSTSAFDMATYRAVDEWLSINLTVGLNDKT